MRGKYQNKDFKSFDCTQHHAPPHFRRHLSMLHQFSSKDFDSHKIGGQYKSLNPSIKPYKWHLLQLIGIVILHPTVWWSQRKWENQKGDNYVFYYHRFTLRSDQQIASVLNIGYRRYTGEQNYIPDTGYRVIYRGMVLNTGWYINSQYI